MIGLPISKVVDKNKEKAAATCNAGINFMHNHLLLGQLPNGGHLSINDVCHLWIFHYNGKNW